VAWTGSQAPVQTRLLGGESPDESDNYYLWRRWIDGTAAPTRRVTGLADPDDPACPDDGSVDGGTTTTGPCYGPLTEQESALGADISSLPPAISANGRRVAFLTGAGPRPNNQTGRGLDLYLTDMSPGVSRKQGTTELTREGGTGGDPGTGSPLEGVTMSPDGRYLAVATFRTTYVLPTLRTVGGRRTTPNARELFVVDLTARTIERALLSSSGGDTDGGVDANLSISGGGTRVAFVSPSTNLFFGDANDRSDAFVVTRTPEPPPQPPVGNGGEGGGEGTLVEDPGDSDPPALKVRAKAGKAGRLELTITAPAAGTLKAVVKARAGRPRRTRTLATATKRTLKGGRVKITLKPVRRYRGELRRRKKLSASVSVAFVASRGGQRRRGARKVVLRQKIPHARKKR
jgi:hypothetical protein